MTGSEAEQVRERSEFSAAVTSVHTICQQPNRALQGFLCLQTHQKRVLDPVIDGVSHHVVTGN